MLVKTKKLKGIALDWAVAKCEGGFDLNQRQDWHNKPWFFYFRDDDEDLERVDKIYLSEYEPSTDWSQGGPIIEQEGITTAYCYGDLGEPKNYWVATAEPQSWGYGYGPYHEQQEDKSVEFYKSEAIVGPTPLIAALRCYVAAKLGDEFDIPEELVNASI